MNESTNAVVTVDEELWFGNVGDDKELEERASQSMAAVAARVLGAKPFPAAARKLEELTRDVSTKIEHVVGVLESDPGLSMRLLRLVNSAGYALRVRCTSVRHAASLVGMRRLHQLATTAAVLDLFENDNPAIKSLLGHAAVVGAFCRYLAVHVDLPPDELFTCGFLHDIGKLMLIDAEGEPYLDLVRQAGDSPDALHVLEQQHFGFDHAVLGAHVLKNWRIPNPVPRVVAWHHNVARAYQADPGTASMVQTLRLADQLSYLVRTNPDAEGIVLAAQSPAASYLGVSEAQLASMWADLSRLSQRIHATPGADQGELIPREESMPPSMRKKKRGKSIAPVRSLPPGTLSAMPEAALEGSLPAPSLMSPGSGTISEMPKAFVCVVCNRASFGSRCPVCSGHVCAKHQVGVEQWCTECASAYQLDVRSNAFPMWERLTALGIVIGAGLLSVVVAVLAGRPVVGALVGSTLLASLCILLVVVGRRFWIKRTFLQKRGHVALTDEPLPLGLNMPPEPAIAVRHEPPLGVRPTVPAAAGIPALFSMMPASHEPPPPSVAVAPPPPSIAAPAPAPTDIAPADPAQFSSHAPAHAMVSMAPREPLPTVPSRKRHNLTEVGGFTAPVRPPSAPPPPPAEATPATHAEHDSVVPDAPAWRPVARTEPASLRSRTPSEIRRLADLLPSVPPAPVVPVIEEEPPPSVAEAPAMASPPEVTAPVTVTEVPSFAAVGAPPDSERKPEFAEPPPASTPEPAESSSPSPEASGVFIAAACHPVEPSLLVACRPSSLRPIHYACSRTVT